MLQHPDLRTCLQEQVILQALPRALWGESHIPHRAQWGTPTTWARRDTFVPCLGKQESCTVPLQSCVPCKSRRMALKSAQSTTHCSHSAIIPKALCLLHPSWPLNSSPSLSNQHTLYFLKHSGFEHILLSLYQHLSFLSMQVSTHSPSTALHTLGPRTPVPFAVPVTAGPSTPPSASAANHMSEVDREVSFLEVCGRTNQCWDLNIST